MTTATATHLAPAVVAAPAPVACSWCALFPGLCPVCGGSGRSLVEFDLGRTRAYVSRPVKFAQWSSDALGLGGGFFCGRLASRRLKTRGSRVKWSQYLVQEFALDGSGRAFQFTKVGTTPENARQHHVLLLRGYVGCDCDARSYRVSDKRNVLAMEEGGRVYPTTGCVHGDFIRAANEGGWL
jgi:hypothetical protein